MQTAKQRIRVVTYNIHKSRGLDRRVDPTRIVEVLATIDADVIALQEVVSLAGKAPEKNQAKFFADELGYEYCLNENRRRNSGIQSNMILSRLPVRAACDYDLTLRPFSSRGCLRADIELRGGRILHVFNVHLGLVATERRHQARRLVGPDILLNQELSGARLVLGDFNEWTRGLATQLLSSHLKSVDIRHHTGRTKTYPGILPVLHLDHIYFDATLHLERVRLYRSRAALVASDHLPLVAEFSM
jgi:endonuclease/exonuclease/phosphatase family metal-dependent hydrolase